MKGVINLIEVITVLIVMFLAFSIFFPGFAYRNRWSDAYLTLVSRDSILTMDRLGNLYNYSFSPDLLGPFLSQELSFSQTNLIGWSETDGAIKNTFIIACNCTDSEITTLSAWFSGLTFNGRTINVLIPKTNLESIGQPSDVLLIMDYKPLGTYQQNIQNYINSERGVVEVMNFASADQINNDISQNQTFGLNAVSIVTGPAQTSDSFSRNPANTSDIFYETYKYFYHLPMAVKTIPNQASAVPNDTIINNCGNFTQGNITIVGVQREFWDCGSSIWFDTDNNGNADTQVLSGNDFSISATNLHLNYINGFNQVGISLRPTYVFSDFLNPVDGGQLMDIQPADGNQNKIILTALPSNYSVAILNQTGVSKTAWIAQFPDGANGDDEKLLLTSLLFWASNKRVQSVLSPNIQVGLETTYINTMNQDMFEVYTFGLGLGSPFGRGSP